MFAKARNNISQMQMIALGFFCIILIGTLLLMTPAASRSGTPTDFLTALFTSTSATCVTGLVVTNTYLHWSLFGQIIIITLIQIGGLGFITFGFGFSLFLRKKITLRQRGLLKESVNVLNTGGIVRLARLILRGTLLFEGVGAIILTLCFWRDMPFHQALYYGIFHSISAFCNAGFDLMGAFGMSSFIGYNANWMVCLTLMALILIGGIGFFVWSDLKEQQTTFSQICTAYQNCAGHFRNPGCCSNDFVLDSGAPCIVCRHERFPGTFKCSVLCRHTTNRRF